VKGRAALVAAVVALHLAVIASFGPSAQDLPATYLYPKAHAIAGGAVPYREVPYEYPPATLPLLLAPLAVGEGPVDYHRSTIWLYALADAGVIGLLTWSYRRRTGALAVALLVWTCSLLVLGRLAFTRFDLAAGLALLGAGLTVRSAPWAARLIGVAGALKVAPLAAIAVLPQLRRRWPAIVGNALLVPVAAQLAFVVWTSDRGLDWLGEQAGRQVQVESWPAVLADAGRVLGANVRWVQEYSQTTDALAGTLPDALGLLFGLAAAAWLAAWGLATWRGRTGGPLAVLALLGGLVALSPVLSPQYLLWLTPLAAWLAPRYLGQALLLVVVCVVTRLEVSLAYDDLRTFDADSVALLALRNVLLAAWVAAVAVRAWRGGAEPSGPRTAAARRG
jgi:hypothetical protein